MRRLFVILALPLLSAGGFAQEQVATVTTDAPIYLSAAITQVPLSVATVGSTLKVLQTQGDWLQVEFKDPQWGRRVGWLQAIHVHIDAVRESKPAAIQAAVPASPSLEQAEAPVVARAPAQEPAPPAAIVSEGKRKDIKVHGYVTNVTSPTQFEIEDYRITRDRQFTLDLDHAEGATFRPEDIHVGVELEIKGSYDAATGDLRAKSIKVDMEQFKKRKQTAVISYPPHGVTQTNTGWSGLFIADGQRIVVTPATNVLFGLTSREKKQAKKVEKGGASNEADVRPLRSLTEVTAGMLMSYEGTRQPDGAILCETVTFSHNDLEDGEAKLWKSLTPQVKSFTGDKPAELKINGVGKFKMIRDERVQSYVSNLGRSLVPAYERELPTTNPRKLDWRFFVIEEKAPNAFALANGTVVVNSGLFSVVEDEAQLAAVMGHEIAHATQEHTWREMQFHKNERIGLAIGAAVAAGFGKNNLATLLALTQAAIQNGYSRYVENQADRVGLEYMVAAGYDPREAPRLWKNMTKTWGDHPTNFFWSNHDNASTRRSYLMNELRNNFADVDFANMKRDSQEFGAVKELLAVRQSKQR